MKWNPWIEIEGETPSSDAAKKLYADHRNPLTKRVPDTVRLNSLVPEVADLVQRLHNAAYENATGIPIREREISALIVASYNGCVH